MWVVFGNLQATLTEDKTPENIDWWIDIEKKYQRNLIAEKRKSKIDKEK